MLNTLKIAEAVGELDDKYIEAHFAYREKLAASRAAKAETSSPRRFKLKYALAAAAAAVIVAVSAFAVANIAKTPSVPAPSEESNAAVSAFTIPDNAVLPPTRWGNGTMLACLDDHYDWQKTYESADIVAKVRVGDWLCEYESGLEGTRYSATLEEVLKGQAKQGDNIILAQEGNSKATLAYFPLFTYGEEMLLFLHRDNTQPNVYWITGSYSTVLRAFYANGKTYYFDAAGVLSDNFATAFGYKYDLPDMQLLEEISENAKKSGSIWADNIIMAYTEENAWIRPFLLPEEELFELIKQLGKN